jgi:hypothetical protein
MFLGIGLHKLHMLYNGVHEIRCNGCVFVLMGGELTSLYFKLLKRDVLLLNLLKLHKT